jgi:DNA repair exonuclease SbcCD ATPase subunit
MGIFGTTYAASVGHLCRSCGEDITEHARYTRWTQCSYCYWKGRLDHQPPLNDLLRKRGELKARINELGTPLGQLTPELRNLEQQLENELPIWKKVLWISPRDDRLDKLRQSVQEVNRELWDVRREQEGLESTIRSARHVQKRFDAASRGKVAAEKRRQQAKQRTAELNSHSCKKVTTPSINGTRFSFAKRTISGEILSTTTFAMKSPKLSFHHLVDAVFVVLARTI